MATALAQPYISPRAAFGAMVVAGLGALVRYAEEVNHTTYIEGHNDEVVFVTVDNDHHGHYTIQLPTGVAGRDFAYPKSDDGWDTLAATLTDEIRPFLAAPSP